MGIARPGIAFGMTRLLIGQGGFNSGQAAINFSVVETKGTAPRFVFAVPWGNEGIASRHSCLFFAVLSNSERMDLQQSAFSSRSCGM